MINIEDKSYKPDISEIKEYVGCGAFDALFGHMTKHYGAACSIEYSGDKILLGWNVKYKKAGRTLCTVYPRAGHFPLLLVIGQKEKPQIEALLPSFSEEFRKIYSETREGMGQRWLLFDISSQDEVYGDILRAVEIRRGKKSKDKQQISVPEKQKGY